MKKRLFILPLFALASGLLTGCGNEKEQPIPPAPPAPVDPVDPDPPAHTHKYSWKYDDEKHWQECSCSEIKSGSEGVHMSFDKNGLCDDCGYRICNDFSKLAPETILNGSLKRVTEVEDGKSYYLVVCKYNENGRLMFINGEPHKDLPEGETEEKVYPFYMSETEISNAADLDKAAKVTVNFKEGSDKYFNLIIDKEGTTNHGKYISLYKSTATSGPCLSIHCADEIGETYADPSEKGQVKECFFDFEWLEEYKDYDIKTFCSMIKDERKDEEEPKPRFLGTGSKFVSVDCADDSKALNADYNFAYLYEVVDAE